MRFFTVARGPGHRLQLRGHGRQPRGRCSPRWPSRRCSWAWRRWPRTPAALSLSGMLRRARARGAGRPAGRLLVLVAAALFGRPPGRERAHPRRRSQHAPGTDDDPRGDGAGPRRAGLRLHPVRRGAEAVGARRAAGRHRCCRVRTRLVAGRPGGRAGAACWPWPWSVGRRRVDRWPGCGWSACRSSWWPPRCSRSLALVLRAEVRPMNVCARRDPGVLLVLTNLRLLGSSRLAACIRAVALQGVLLGLLPLLAPAGRPRRCAWSLIAGVSIAAQGAACFPGCCAGPCARPTSAARSSRFVGFTASLLVGRGPARAWPAGSARGCRCPARQGSGCLRAGRPSSPCSPACS